MKIQSKQVARWEMEGKERIQPVVTKEAVDRLQVAASLRRVSLGDIITALAMEHLPPIPAGLLPAESKKRRTNG